MESNPAHAQHMRDIFAYVDAATADLQQQMHLEIKQEVAKQLNSHKVSVEVNKTALKVTEDAVRDVLTSLNIPAK